MVRPPPKSKDKPESLDLGLSAFLGTEQKAPQEPPPATSSGTTEKATTLSEFEVLANAGDWASLSRRCDELLPPQVAADERLEVIEVRLWWARSQYELRAVPNSILAAPLEEASRALQGHVARAGVGIELGDQVSRLKRMCAALLARIARDLTKQGEAEVGERLAGLGRLLDQSVLDPVLGQSVPTQTEGSLKEAAHERAERAGASARSVERSSKQSRGTQPRERLRSGFEPAPNPTRSELQSSTTATTPARRGALGVVALLLIVGMIWYLFPNFFSGETFWEEQSIEPQARSLPDAIEPPQMKLAPPTMVKGVNQLDAILEDIKNDRSQVADLKSRTSASAAVIAPVESSPSQGTLPTSGGKQQGADSSSAQGSGGRGKERIDMSGPLEPPDFPRSRGRGSDDARTGQGQDVRQGDTGSGSRTQLPGVPERPGFEDFKRPRTYRTLVETDVMSDPTLRARVRDTLPAGVEVLVEGREGYWLRVRSQRGNVGYILAQAAARQD